MLETHTKNNWKTKQKDMLLNKMAWEKKLTQYRPTPTITHILNYFEKNETIQTHCTNQATYNVKPFTKLGPHPRVEIKHLQNLGFNHHQKSTLNMETVKPSNTYETMWV